MTKKIPCIGKKPVEVFNFFIIIFFSKFLIYTFNFSLFSFTSLSLGVSSLSLSSAGTLLLEGGNGPYEIHFDYRFLVRCFSHWRRYKDLSSHCIPFRQFVYTILSPLRPFFNFPSKYCVRRNRIGRSVFLGA